MFPLIQEGLGPVREALEREVREHGARLLVLDGLMTVYDLYPDAREVRRFLFELAGVLGALGCTLLVTSSRVELDETANAVELTMADVLIRLTQSIHGTRAERSLQAVKVRGQTPLLGLRGMRERVALLGGELEIESAPGTGGAAMGIRQSCLANRFGSLRSTRGARPSADEHRGLSIAVRSRVGAAIRPCAVARRQCCTPAWFPRRPAEATPWRRVSLAITAS